MSRVTYKTNHLVQNTSVIMGQLIEHVRALLDLLFKHTNSNRKKRHNWRGEDKEFLQIIAEENRFYTQPKKLNKSNQIAHHHHTNLLQLASHT